MSYFPAVLFDEAHSEAWTLDPARARVLNPANPADAAYGQAAEALAHRGFTVSATREPTSAESLAAADVLVIAHPADTHPRCDECLLDPRQQTAELGE